MVSPSPTSKSATVVISSPRVSTGVRSTVMSCPQIASSPEPSSFFLTQGISVPKPKRITSSIRSFTRPLIAAHQPDDIGGLAARRHEIDQRDGAAFRSRNASPGSACCPSSGARCSVISPRARSASGHVLSCRAAPQNRRRNRMPASTASRSIRRGRPVPRFRNRRSSHSLQSCRAMMSPVEDIAFQIVAARPPVHRGLERGNVDRGGDLSIASGNRRRQFGCSSTVPGMLG